MPSTYAHYRLGQDVLSRLTGNLERLTKENYDKIIYLDSLKH